MTTVVRPSELAELVKSMAIDVREYIEQELAPVIAKQGELQARVAELERQLAATKEGDDR
jgi:hypothetical protein